jgi:crooked neck
MIDWDMVFADDERESNPTSFKFLQMAHAWKNAQAKSGGTAVLSGFTAATTTTTTSAAREDADDAHSDVASSHGGESD